MSSLNIKCLAVVLHLEKHETGVVDEAAEGEGTRGVDVALVEQHLMAAEHILVGEKFDVFPRSIGRRTTELDIPLGMQRVEN